MNQIRHGSAYSRHATATVLFVLLCIRYIPFYFIGPYKVSFHTHQTRMCVIILPHLRRMRERQAFLFRLKQFVIPREIWLWFALRVLILNSGFFIPCFSSQSLHNWFAHLLSFYLEHVQVTRWIFSYENWWHLRPWDLYVPMKKGYTNVFLFHKVHWQTRGQLSFT
jgi:hypothetical protein